MSNMTLIKELAIEALDDEATIKRWRWVAVLNLANENEIFGLPVGPEGMEWAKEKIEELEANHCLSIKKKVIIPDELKAKVPALAEEMERIANDPKVREEGEKLHRELSRLTAEDLFRVIG